MNFAKNLFTNLEHPDAGFSLQNGLRVYTRRACTLKAPSSGAVFDEEDG
jgi:hypothetical protein